MMLTILVRFLVGGVVVSTFAALGEVIGPKSLAGIFGAAPSIAIATLGLTVVTEGQTFASVEGRSMLAGALAFLAYANCCVICLGKGRWSAIKASSGALAIWGAVAFGTWLVFLR